MSFANWAVGNGSSSAYQTLSLSGQVLSLVPLGGSVTLPATGVTTVAAGQGIAVSGSSNPTISNTGVLNLVAGNGITITGTAASPIVAANIPNATNSSSRWLQADFGGMPLQLLPGSVVFTLNDSTCPGLLNLINNPLYNMIQVTAQFGIQTVAAQPKVNLGFMLQPNGGSQAYVCGNVNFGNAGTGTTSPPAEFPYVLQAFLIRNVHYTNSTTTFTVSMTPSSNPTLSLITILQSGDGGSSTVSANVRFTFIGSV